MTKNPPPSDEFPKTSNPAQNALTHAGYTRLSQLTQVTEAEIAALHGMGPKAIRILREALAAHGLAFAPPPPPKPRAAKTKRKA